MRLEPDRRHITVPVIGKLRSKENTRRLERLVAKGQARILSITLSQRGGRLVAAVQAIIVQQPRHPTEPDVAAASTSVSAPSGWLSPTMTIRSNGWRILPPGRRFATSSAASHGKSPAGPSGPEPTVHARTKRAALDRRAANLRRQAIDALTTRLARRYGTVVVEDLDVAAIGRGMGRRAFRRTVYQAGIGSVRPTLAYKCQAVGGRLVIADRWFWSSKTHHGCGGYRADLRLGDRLWRCPRCGGLVDRNANAALNLRDWTGLVDLGKAEVDEDVQLGGVAAQVPYVTALAGGHGGQACAQAWAWEVLEDHREVAGANDTRTEPHPGERNPEQGYQSESANKHSRIW